MLELILLLPVNDQTKRLAEICKIIISQLKFVETFAEDLLNINMIQEGVFSLEPTVFKPKEVIKFITEMFDRKMKAKQIILAFHQVQHLQDP